MASRRTPPRFDAPGLDAQVRTLREVDNVTNLGYLALEYLCIAATIAGAVGFAEWRAGWGLAWAWNIPVFATAIVLIGGLQHRLAGLGHEASHFTLLRDKRLNDLVADLFCMFPLLTNIHFYRLFHLAHHQYTNDWERDPDLVNMGRAKGVAAFPMPRWRVVASLYLRGPLPPGRVPEISVGLHLCERPGQGQQRLHGDSPARRLGPLLAPPRDPARDRLRGRIQRDPLAAHDDRACVLARAGRGRRGGPGGDRLRPPARLGLFPIALPTDVFAEVGGSREAGLPDGPDGRPGRASMGDGRSVGPVRDAALGRSR